MTSKPQRAQPLQANEGNGGNKMPSGALIWVGLEWSVMTPLRYFIIITNRDFIPPQSPTKTTQQLMSIIVPNYGFLVVLWACCLTWASGCRPFTVSTQTHLLFSTDIADDGVGGRAGRRTEYRHHPFRHDLAHWEGIEKWWRKEKGQK